jgi:DNA-binding CsgD family transcriptional regulator
MAKRASSFSSFLARVAVSSCFLATLLIYSPNVMVLQSDDAFGFTGRFAEPLLAVASLFALATAVVALVRPGTFERGGPRLLPTAVRIALLAIYAVGSGGFALCILTGAPQGTAAEIVVPILAILAGAGVVPACVCWSKLLDGFELRSAIALVSSSALVATLFVMGLDALPAPATEAIYLVLLVGGVVGVGAFPAQKCTPTTASAASDPESHVEYQVELEHDPADNNTELDSDSHSNTNAELELDAFANRSMPETMRSFFSVMGMALLGMAISSLAMGINPILLADPAIDVQRIGMLAACPVLIIFSQVSTSRPTYTFLFSVLLPVVAAVTLVLCSFPEDLFVRNIALIVACLFFSMVTLVAISTACAVSNAREFSRWLVFSVLIATFTLVAVLGLFLGARVSWLTENHNAFLVVLTAMYGSFLLLFGCLRGGSKAPDAAEPTAADNGNATVPTAQSPSYEDRISDISERARLTPREREILSYLGRGHSSVFVAKTLLISESTVYTHVRNMYRKLGVSSREELIELIGTGMKKQQEGEHTK